jgi:hypothetical protein
VDVYAGKASDVPAGRWVLNGVTYLNYVKYLGLFDWAEQA